MGGVVATRVVSERQEENPVYALGTGVARDARWRTAPRVQKAILGYASLMEAVAAASTHNAPRGHKGVLYFARHTVEGRDAQSWDVPRELKGALRSVKDTVGESAAPFRVAACALRASMEEPSSVLHMVVARGVLCPTAPRVPGDVQISVSGMVGVGDASRKVVGRARREALISARLTVEGSGAHGAMGV